MTLSVVLDVIIGLVFTYFLLATIAGGIQEVIAGFFSWRGTYLSKGIDVIIDNAESASWKWDGEFLRAHFTAAAPKTAAERLQQVIAARPPGTPAPGGEAELKRVLAVHTHPLVRGTPSDLPSYVPARNFGLAMLETLRDGSQAPLITQAQNTIANLPDGDLKRTLSLFMNSAGGDLDKFRDHIENWFDDAMDRVSGIYKRLSQYVLLILGLGIAIVLNVDSIHLARTLWQETALRSAIVADATAAASQPPKPAPGNPAAGTVANAPAGSAPNPPPTTDSILGPARAAMQDFESHNIPYGWSNAPPLGLTRDWLSVLCGWIMTALAIALGAPFWFGLVQQLTNLRNSGPPPKRADGTAGA